MINSELPIISDNVELVSALRDLNPGQIYTINAEIAGSMSLYSDIYISTPLYNLHVPCGFKRNIQSSLITNGKGIELRVNDILKSGIDPSFLTNGEEPRFRL